MFAQSLNMSYFINEYNRPTATFADRLLVLENVRDGEVTDAGEFYHDALKLLLQKIPDISSIEDWDATNASARIICHALGAERYAAAAPELWLVVENFDISRSFHQGFVNQGLVMQDALIALGQIGAAEYVPHIAQRLTDLNTRETSDVETRRRVQRAVAGSISALEDLKDPAGYKPIFFASTTTSWYDSAIKNIASLALPNIVEDPADIIIEIIRDTSVAPPVKYEAWRDMLSSRAPESSKARVAAAALSTGWSYPTSNQTYQRFLREMRVSAIDTIRVMGVADDSVYANLERSFNTSFVTPNPDYDEIRRTLNCLSAIASDEAVQLLLKFLRELHTRRESGPWGNRERQVFSWVIPSLGATKTQSEDVALLLNTIQRSRDYTGVEQSWAGDALRELGR